jgi:hypothetical protein
MPPLEGTPACHNFWTRTSYIKIAPNFVRDLELTRRKRNATLHRGEEVTAVDAELALNALQQLIFAIERPSWVSPLPEQESAG